MANTVNWIYPATGAVDPTAAQVAQQSAVWCDATIDGTGTTLTINHNLGLTAAQVTAGGPEVEIEPTSVHASDGTGAARVTTYAVNTIVLTFITGVAQTLRLRIRRPHTLPM